MATLSSEICISENSLVITQDARNMQGHDSILEDGDWEGAALSAGRGSCPLEETEVKSLEGHQQYLTLVPVLSELIHDNLSLETVVTFFEGVLI